MPWGDGTGPEGTGPMTGRAGGYCAGYNTPGYMNAYGGRFGGRGFRGGFGGRGFRGGFGGRGYRNRYYVSGFPGWGRYNAGYPAGADAFGNPYVPDVEPEQEKEMLKRESGVLQSQLDEIKMRMDELSKEKKDKK
ncbi:MAG: DUF5320 domain-containing protein [Actinomycetota bacterium]|nr:DUF5320 domain-containing protein [Actinomycetota bacterium]